MREPANPPRRTGGPYAQGGLRDGHRRQFLELPPKILLAFPPAFEGPGGSFQLRVRTPSSQVRVLISVDFEPAAGQPDDVDVTINNNTIWLAGTNESQGGASSQDCPNSSVEGMRFTPTPFPSTVVAGVVTLDPGLLGYAREFVTASPWIAGIVALGVPGESSPAAGAWVLKVSYQPDGVVLPDDAWAEICNLAAREAFAIS